MDGPPCRRRDLTSAYRSGNTSDYIGASFNIWRDGPWHWLRPGTQHRMDDVAQFARNPLPGDEVCLAGDAWDLVYSGWITSALRSSGACMDRFFPGSAWKPAATQCCEYRIRTNATVGGSPWYNWNARYNVQGCGEENWSPGAAYLKHERWWPAFDNWQPTAGSTTCVMPANSEACSVDAAKYRHPAATPLPPAFRRVLPPAHNRAH